MYVQISLRLMVSTVYPKKYAHGFVVLCFVVVMQSFIMNSHEVFIHIHQGCFAGTGAIVRLPQCQWSKPDGYGKISQCITTTKHSKAKTVCIFLGIYCSTLGLPWCAIIVVIFIPDPYNTHPMASLWGARYGVSTVSLKSLICFLPLLCYIGSQYCDTWTPFRCPMGHPAVGSRGVSRLRDSNLKLSVRSGIWQAPRQHCYWCARRISERYEHFNNRPRSFMTLWGLPVGRLVGYWDGAQGAVSIRKTVLPGMAIPMLKIRRPNGRLIFNMEIAIRR